MQDSRNPDATILTAAEPHRMTLGTMSLHNHGTPKSSPTSKSRTKPSADSPAGPIERNESWQLR
ncbi:hypothetical protein RHRU231_960082 [Rhodococcus ruber]|uniref:Uncharacterized protein n=1 Tax=Rhodococcus ruber TaxID=1830 RepID=A0A098BV02_9NOCA|nr:hypothetical protein RHRU231_960082 [Rhodococcus ruber]